MPLDMAIKMLNLKTLTNVYDTYNFLFLSAITLATAFLTILVETYSQCFVPCDLFFLDCWSLLIEFSIFSYCTYYSLFRSDHDFVFV
jgi:hypothetical protein